MTSRGLWKKANHIALQLHEGDTYSSVYNKDVWSEQPKNIFVPYRAIR